MDGKIINESNSLVVKDISQIHPEKYDTERYSEYINQFKTEVAKEINVDANYKENPFDICNDDPMINKSNLLKRRRSPVTFEESWKKNH